MLQGAHCAFLCRYSGWGGGGGRLCVRWIEYVLSSRLAVLNCEAAAGQVARATADLLKGASV